MSCKTFIHARHVRRARYPVKLSSGRMSITSSGRVDYIRYGSAYLRCLVCQTSQGEDRLKSASSDASEIPDFRKRERNWKVELLELEGRTNFRASL